MERGGEHRQLVFVREQRCGHIATVVARRAGYAAAILEYMVTPAKARPGTREERDVSTRDATERPWITIVWDDPVNLMTYVTYVFQKLFGYSEPHATKLMMQVHNEGKAVVSAGSRESMEVDVTKLHSAGLWATMQQDR
jgi:ATP-dependent Clp protease adaptor protein ClpS